MGEAIFDGRMIGLQGEVVTYPQWFFALLINTQRRLVRVAKKQQRPAAMILERDKPTGFWRVLPEVKVQLGSLLDLPNYNPRRTMRAFDPGFHSGRARHCGRRGLIGLLESGIDTNRRDMQQCEADLEDSRRSAVRVSQIVSEVRAKRVRTHVTTKYA